ncbi:MAG: peroxide stress protein YaaA [Saprospiraceae bacterium]|nr:peroxide stress protein YaaA [Saprospiraceae bacterium]
MLTILSPSKTSDPTPIKIHQPTSAIFTKETAQLIAILKKKSVADLMSLMTISEKLADQNYRRFQNFNLKMDDDFSKAAILTFNGEVYVGLDAGGLSQQDLDFAQQHVRILSGLYGSLRPLDLIREYRLEMGTRLATTKGTNLYQFWRDKITPSIHADLLRSGNNYLINLASDEYFKSLDQKTLQAVVIQIDFFDIKNGKRTFISFNAKKARGMMANYIIKNRINEPSALTKFDMDGYILDSNSSTDSHFTFVRH